MDAKRRQNILKSAQNHVSLTIQQIDHRIDMVRMLLEALIRKMNTPHIYSNESFDKSEPLLDEKKKFDLEFQLEDLELLKNSPYFSDIEVTFQDGQKKTVRISKFGLPNSSIYSWVAPVATLRFKSCGRTSYEVPNQPSLNVIVHSKKQLAIHNAEIKFMSFESQAEPRTLIYQAELGLAKREFMLKEIIAQMEEYQDQIIRLDPKGSILISGPAGSGKTTLALHRIAYLLQSPETQEMFKPEDVLILLQDESTKQYFEKLLPELGIKNASIRTYSEFLKRVLRIEKTQIVEKFNSDPILEYFKYNALREVDGKVKSNSYFHLLYNIYKELLPKEQLELYRRQKKEQILDRIDLNILIKLLFSKQPKDKKRGKWDLPLYSLIVIDEAENYLSEEISILKNCLDDRTNALIYTGDLVQTTRAYALKSWDEVGESFSPERKIILPIVYRTTRQILDFIKSQGYDIEIPSNLRGGKEVVKKSNLSVNEKLDYIKQLIKNDSDSLIGIITINMRGTEAFANLDDDRVKVMSASQSQGVEFEKVILIDNLLSEHLSYESYPQVAAELEDLNRNLLYVAYTRAREELHILS